jgi:hypothetical protein
MEVFLSPYELKKNGSDGVQRGTLIKVSENGNWGVADLCPHRLLGDCPWEEEVRQEGPLYLRAMNLATEDFKARKSAVSLLSDKKVLNNFLVTDFQSVDLNEKRFENQTVKIKGDGRVALLAEALNRVQGNLKIRIDFNSKLSPAEFDIFISLLSAGVISRIEYIEDPAPVSAKWVEWNKKIPLASDWQKTGDPSMAKFRIVKPAREDVPGGSGLFTFTSSMDHPVGVAHGLRVAQKFATNASGFLTLNIFETTPFHKYFVTDGPWLGFSELALRDSGIGMSEELQKLNWAGIKDVLS